jgi:hypothetical protein
LLGSAGLAKFTNIPAQNAERRGFAVLSSWILGSIRISNALFANRSRPKRDVFLN